MPFQRDPRHNALLSLAEWVDGGGPAARMPYAAVSRAEEAPSLAELLRRRGKGEARQVYAGAAADAEFRAEIDAVRARLRDFAATVERLRAARGAD